MCWEGVYGQPWGLLAQGLGDFSLASQDSLFSLFFWEISACLETLLQLLFATDFIFSIACLLLEAEASWPEPFLAVDVFSRTALVSLLATQLLLRLLSTIVRCPGERPEGSLRGEQPTGGTSMSSFSPRGLQRVQV